MTYGETVLALVRKQFPLSLRSQALLFAVEHTPTDFADVAGALCLLDRKSAVTRHADTLLAYGLVERHENPEDRRKVFLSLTSQGRKVIKALNNGGDGMPALTLDD